MIKLKEKVKNNPSILFKDYLKIYVLLKDKIIFESELEKDNIEYYCDIEKQPMLENKIRYFIKNIDRNKIDNIFIKNGIIAETETIQVSDYRDGKKVLRMQFWVGGIVFIIMLLIIIIERLSK